MTEVDTTKTRALSISKRAMATLAEINAPEGYSWGDQITRSVLQQESGVPFYVRFENEPYQGEELEFTKRGKPKMAPARLCDVVNILTGELQLLIMNAVLESELRRYADKNYENKSFVGRAYGIVGFKDSDETDPDFKRYRTYKIRELRVNNGTVQAEPGGAKIDATGKDAIDRAKEAKHTRRAE